MVLEEEQVVRRARPAVGAPVQWEGAAEHPLAALDRQQRAEGLDSIRQGLVAILSVKDLLQKWLINRVLEHSLFSC